MKWREPEFERWRKRTFWESLVGLLAHLLGTTVIFLALATLTWGVSWILSSLQSVHRFPDDVEPIIHKFEVGSMYVDIGLCGILILAGAWRFCSELLSGDHS